MDILLPDYQKCLVNLSSSILKRFGINDKHSTIKYIDDLLLNYHKIVFVFFDGMGSYVLDKHLTKETFLQAHKIDDISSVFPPTTAAATTAFLACKNPNESGWLGWHLYFKDIDEDLTLFTGQNYYDETKPISDYVKNKLGYENIVSKIKNNGYSVKEVCSYDGFNNLDKVKNEIINFSLNSKEGFLYVYYDQPDHDMHLTGVSSEQTHHNIVNINKMMEEVYEKIDDDTLIIVSADHGLIDTKTINLYYDDFIKDNLIVPPYCDARATMFRVKDKESFYQYFKHNYGGAFDLYNKEEVKRMKLFGDLEDSSKFDEALGDYLAIGKKDYIFTYFMEEPIDFKAHHSGYTRDEMVIPLIILKK